MFASKIARSATLSLAVAAVISSIAVPATAGVTIFGGSEDKQQVQLPDFVKLVEDNGPGVVNIQMIRNARTVENAGIPGLDPRGAEIFRRFAFPSTSVRRKFPSSAARAPASSSPPTASS